MTRLKLAVLAAALISASTFAHEYQLKTLAIDHPFTRATPPGGSVAGAFMAIANQGKDADRLVGVASPAATSVQIHEMSMDGGVMRMRPHMPRSARVARRPCVRTPCAGPPTAAASR